jgi:glycosyltransferase involved in cell wall biosynthesis
MVSFMKTAIVHYWLTTYGGGEKCVEAFCDIWPSADLFTLIYRPEIFVDSVIARHKVTSSFLDRLPFAKTKFRHYFPLFPFAVEQFDLRGYDVVISSASGFAHGVLTDPDQTHICYMHTPMRYAWSDYHEYMNYPELKGKLKNTLARMLFHRIRQWDYMAAQRVDHFIANSEEVRRRIWKYYRREATVIHPPIEVGKFLPSPDRKKEDFYFTLSRLVPYKKMDVIVNAFLLMPDRKLIIGGDGPEMAKLKILAAGSKNIEFVGFLSDSQKVSYLQSARAFIFAAKEDFGMVPVEAQAAGTPVIAFRKGGAMETVVENKTGLFFEEQTPESLSNAVMQFETLVFDSNALITWAGRFSKQRYQEEISSFVQSRLATARGKNHA